VKPEWIKDTDLCETFQLTVYFTDKVPSIKMHNVRLEPVEAKPSYVCLMWIRSGERRAEGWRFYKASFSKPGSYRDIYSDQVDHIPFLADMIEEFKPAD
jgi:hypothetical protein